MKVQERGEVIIKPSGALINKSCLLLGLPGTNPIFTKVVTIMAQKTIFTDLLLSFTCFKNFFHYKRNIYMYLMS